MGWTLGDMWQSNLVLMVAASELYEALDEVFACLNNRILGTGADPTEDHEFWGECVRATDKARAALAKAREVEDALQSLKTYDALKEDRNRLSKLVNNPQTADFLEAVRTEAAHQVQRWGEAHDRGKSAENWYWLVGYLAGKALRAAIEGDREKALHHTISAAAALSHWHAAISADESGSGRIDAEIAKAP